MVGQQEGLPRAENNANWHNSGHIIPKHVADIQDVGRKVRQLFILSVRVL